jgi:nucleoside-diphosphate-sugar epimerase
MLTTELFAPGTKWETLDGVIDGYAYGAAKVFGERMCVAAARQDGLSTVSIRVGWCQAGENHPSTINAGGNPKLAKAGFASKSGQAELTWFRNMWLSTPDFNNLFERAILADPTDWPRPGIVVNGMSDNAGMAWGIEPARRLIGYAPRDNVWDHV